MLKMANIILLLLLKNRTGAEDNANIQTPRGCRIQLT